MVIRIGGGTWTDVANGTLNKTLFAPTDERKFFIIAGTKMSVN